MIARVIHLAHTPKQTVF